MQTAQIVTIKPVSFHQATGGIEFNIIDDELTGIESILSSGHQVAIPEGFADLPNPWTSAIALVQQTCYDRGLLVDPDAVVEAPE